MRPGAPLAGRTIAVTRPRERAHALVTALETLGAVVIAAPAIVVVPPATYDPLDAALRRLRAPTASEPAYQWLALTSAAAVDAVATRLGALGLTGVGEKGHPGSAVRGTRVAVVGEATARAARLQLGRVDLVPTLHTADGLAAALPPLWGARVLFPCADRARDALPALLTARGARVDRVVAYRTLDAPPDALSDVAVRARAGTLDAVVVASPSAAGALVRALTDAGVPAGTCAAVCIGPTTADACHARGIRVVAVAAAPHDDALVAATLESLTQDRHPLPTD